MSTPLNKPGKGQEPTRPHIHLRRKVSFPNAVTPPPQMDLSPVVGFTVAGQVPPPPNHLPMPLPPDSPRFSLDVNLAAARAEEGLLVYIIFPLLVLPCALFLFFRAFFGAALFAALIVMIFLAMYYARRPRITHRLARFLRTVFYTTFTYPGDRRQPRLSLRLSVIVVVSVLLGLLGSRRGFGSARHDRPAEVSTVESSANP